MNNNDFGDFGNFGDFGGESQGTQSNESTSSNISSDPFSDSSAPAANEVTPPKADGASKTKKKNKGQKGKKNPAVVLIVVFVLLALIIGGIVAAPFVLMKLGDSSIDKGDYKAASTMYSMCFGLFGSKNRASATDAVIDVLAMNTDDGINHALENGIEVHITYDLNGGRFINSSRQTEVVLKNKEDFSDFYRATKDYYDFVGWHVERASYNPDVNDAMLEFSLKADFKPTVYKISYTNLFSDDKNKNPEKYTVESKTITLENPTRVGYTFEYWEGTDIKGTSTTVVIPQGSTGDRSFVAEWEANKYSVAYTDDDPNDDWKLPDIEDKFKTGTYDDKFAFPNYNSSKIVGYRRGYKHTGWKSDKKTFTIKEESLGKDEYHVIWAEAEDVTLQPTWEERVWNWECDLDGGATEGKTKGTYTITSEDFEIVNSVKKPGNIFLGWTYENDASTAADPDTPKSTITTPQTKMVVKKGTIGHFKFTAKWDPITYIISLNANGGSVSPSSAKAFYGKNYNIPTPTKTGYTFSGWYNGNSSFKSSGTWTLLENISLTAKWTPKKYKLIFNSAGGSSVSSKTVTYDSSYSVSSSTKKGYNFVGWFDASGNQYSGGVWKTDAPTGEVTVTARWEPIQYKISLNANGGSLSSGYSYTVAYEQPYSLPTPTRTGYDFTGWYNGSSSVKSSGTWTQLNNVSLTAKWTAKQYTLSFDSDGGPSQSSKQVTYDSSYSVPSISRTGYEFLGWYDSSGKQYTSGTWKTASNMKLTARWRANKYTVSFNANGGSVSPSSVQVTYDSKYDFPEPYKKGYEFMGWYSGSSNFGDSGTWKQTSNLSLTAKWKVGEYYITLKPEGGTVDGGKTKFKFTYGSSYSLPSATRKGYYFDGWYKGSKEFSPTGTYEYDDDTVLKAKWLGKEYKVFLDANGGSVNKSTVYVTYGDSYSLPTPTRTGYEFEGWYNGSSKMKLKDDYEYDGDMTLVAKWEVKKFKITLNATTGGSVSPKSITVTYGESFDLPTPTKKGYIFTGWSGDGKRYNAGSNYDSSLDDDIKLTAQWDAIECRIYLDANGGECESYVRVEYGEHYSLPKPVCEGYKFKGWYQNGKRFDISGTWKGEEDIYLVAEWTEIG